MHFSLSLQNFLYTKNDVQKIQKKIMLIEVYECGLYIVIVDTKQRIYINVINWMTHSLAPFLHICTSINYIIALIRYSIFLCNLSSLDKSLLQFLSSILYYIYCITVFTLKILL